MSSFSFMKPANGLWKDAKIAKIQQRVLERITELPHEIRINKHNMELLLLVCNLIENSGINNKEKCDKLKIDKKQLLIQIYNTLYGSITPADCDQLSKSIEFLWDNGHIHRHPTWKMMLYCVGDWFKRKIL